MKQLMTDLLGILLPRERRNFFILICVTTVSALFEASSVASILPLLTVMSDPGLIESNEYLAVAYRLSQADSTQQFQLYLAVIAFVMVVCGLLLKTATAYAITRFSSMREYSISSRILQGYLHRPYEWYLTHHSAKLSRSILADVSGLVGQTLQPLLQLIASAALVLFLVLMLFLAEPVVATVVACVLSVAYLGIYTSIRNYLARLGKRRLEANAQRFRVTQEALEGVKYVKLRSLEDIYVGRFNIPARIMARITARTQVLRDVPRYILEIIAFGGMLAFIMFNLIEENRELTQMIPTLGLVAFAGMRLLPALQIVFSMLASLRTSTPLVQSIAEALRSVADESPDAGDPAPAPLSLTRDLRIEGLEYCYPNTEQAALSGLDMHVPAHTTIGIVGGTGAGKTTAIDLMLGLLEPSRGRILVDDVEITDKNRRNWQRTLGYVPQTIFLTADSVAANIAFGVSEDEIDMDRLIAAAKAAALHDFILSDLPQGYDTPLGERGVRLSGGQRQRIGIARALYFDPAVLIFDEATSALDNITEREVMAAIDNLSGEKTIIMIAHRLTTVKNCDQIFLLEHGRVSASGAFDELAQQSDTFREMARNV